MPFHRVMCTLFMRIPSLKSSLNSNYGDGPCMALFLLLIYLSLWQCHVFQRTILKNHVRIWHASFSEKERE